jgi:hypothetical protein
VVEAVLGGADDAELVEDEAEDAPEVAAEDDDEDGEEGDEAEGLGGGGGYLGAVEEAGLPVYPGAEVDGGHCGRRMGGCEGVSGGEDGVVVDVMSLSKGLSGGEGGEGSTAQLTRAVKDLSCPTVARSIADELYRKEDGN